MDSMIPEQEPQTVVAGDTLKWHKNVPHHFCPSAGWSLSYALVNAAGKIAIPSSDAVADEGRDRFLVTVPGESTTAWAPGQYSWQAFVTNGSERHCIGMGSIVVTADFSSLESGQDLRSHSQKMYDAICAVLEGRASSDVQRYTIGGRSVDKMRFDELETWKRQYAWRISRENGRSPEFQGAKFKRPF